MPLTITNRLTRLEKLASQSLPLQVRNPLDLLNPLQVAETMWGMVWDEDGLKRRVEDLVRTMGAFMWWGNMLNFSADFPVQGPGC